MHILLFGVSGIGKKAVGQKAADLLHVPFYDLEEEVCRHEQMAQEEFILTYKQRRTRDMKRRDVLQTLLDQASDSVIAVTPLFYPSSFVHILKRKDVMAIVLHNRAEEIFARIDPDNGYVYEDNEYKRPHTSHTLDDVKNDLAVYDKNFSRIKFKLECANRSDDSVAGDIVKLTELMK